MQLTMPHVTELRCRACSMLGGMTVETTEEAAAVSEIPRLKVKGIEVRVGERVSLPHCMKSDEDLATFAKEHGRPCPRILLRAENAEAMTLFSMSIREDARHWAPLYFDATFGAAPADERRRILQRVTRAQLNRDITEALHPRPRGKGQA